MLLLLGSFLNDTGNELWREGGLGLRVPSMPEEPNGSGEWCGVDGTPPPRRTVDSGP